MFNIFSKSKSINRELKKCKICDKDENNIKFSLGKDGICGQCKYYSICKICNKEKHYSRMLENGICKDCQKAQNEDMEVRDVEEKRLENTYKLCPFCGEEIKAIAVKCRFCNEMLNKEADKIMHEKKFETEREMTNKNNQNNIKQEIQKPIISTKKWYAGFIVAGIIFALGENNLKRTATDEIIILIIAILAGLLYYWFKAKLRIKSEAGKIILTFVILLFISSVLIGVIQGAIRGLNHRQIRKKCISIVNNSKGFNPQKFANEFSGKPYFDQKAYKECLSENGVNE